MQFGRLTLILPLTLCTTCTSMYNIPVDNITVQYLHYTKAVYGILYNMISVKKAVYCVCMQPAGMLYLQYILYQILI